MKKTSILTRQDRALIKELISAAKKARENSLSPYTGVKVGSAVSTAGGKIYSGTNIESVVPDSTICAERNAIFKALSEGAGDFKFVSVLAFRNKFIYPCGTCRQVLAEHATDLSVILADLSGRYKIIKLSELLPKAYK